MKIYNSMSGKKEEFIPIDGKKVSMYACGVTVYDLSHIGHARQAITYAMISEYLKYRGYEVKYVRNYTDVDDKIISRANETGKNALDFSREQIIETEIDMKNLHVKEADLTVKASECIDSIINFVNRLIEKDNAYATEKGDVYFSVRKFSEYGKLSNRKIDDSINGVRKEVEEGKKDPLDFALWKSAKPGEISWKSPWGNGRPGWHIECSAMILENLGETVDIHGGGKDLVFPHHENEIAQSEALTQKPLSKYWSHCGLIKINGEKMSKSLGNSLTIREILENYNYEVIKYMMFSKHYTSDIDILDRDFLVADKHMYYFYTTLNLAEKFIELNKTNEKVEENINKSIINKFITEMDDDFNTVSALSELHGVFRQINLLLKNNNKTEKFKVADELNEIIRSIKEVYGLLGLFEQNTEEFINNMKNKYLKMINIDIDYIESQIKNRIIAKEIKDFEKADTIRNLLEEKGIILNDTKDGTTWDIKALYNVE